MKTRDKLFLVTATILFALTWVFLKLIINVAQGVGDASADFNPALRSFLISLLVTLIYGVVYYGVYWFVVFIGRLNKKFDQ